MSKRVNVQIGTPYRSYTTEPITAEVQARPQDVPLTSNADEKQRYMEDVLKMIAVNSARKKKAKQIAAPYADQMDPAAALNAPPSPAPKKPAPSGGYQERDFYDIDASGDQWYIIPHEGVFAGSRQPVPEGMDANQIESLAYDMTYAPGFDEGTPKLKPRLYKATPRR